MEQQKRMPDLRFPEFKEEWKLNKLGSYINERNESGTGEFPLYSLTIENGIIPKSERYERSFLVNDINDAYKVMHQYDFAFNPMNLRFGALARLTENKKVLVSKYYNIFYCNEKGDSAFFEYYLTSYKLIQYYNKMSTGSLIEKKRVHYLDFIHFNRHLPSFPEQTKIATFLTSVDDKLTQLKKKKTLLEQYKKGVMQKIFSQEIRFKDEHGKGFPVWKMKKFGEVSSIIMGQSPDSNSYNTEGIGMLLIQGNADISNRKSNPRNWTSNPTKECQIGDIILTVRAPVGAVAKSCHNACLGRGVCAIRNNTLSSIEFLFQFLLDFEVRWGRLEQGSTFTAISGADIKSIEIHLPSIQEQTKIANFLSAIDKKINYCSTQIEKTVLWKKGLLQKMFV